MSHNTRKTFLAYRYYRLASLAALHAGMIDTAAQAARKSAQARQSAYAPALLPASPSAR